MSKLLPALALSSLFACATTPRTARAPRPGEPVIDLLTYNWP